MKTSNYKLVGFAALAFLATSLLVGVHLVSAKTHSVSYYENNVLGISMHHDSKYEIVEQEYLSDVYGFSLLDTTRLSIFSHGAVVLNISWRHTADSNDLLSLAKQQFSQYPDLEIDISRERINGVDAVVLSRMPGVVLNTLVLIEANNRIYEIRYFEEKLDKTAWDMLNRSYAD